MDNYSFTAGADYRVYAATMTGFSGGSADTLRDVIASDGTTMFEANDDDGAIGSASNIAGTVLATAGTYYLRVRQFNTASLHGAIRPFDLYVRVPSGSPTPDREPSDKGATQALRSNWVSNVIGPAKAENDTFAIRVNAGDTIVAIVDVDPERDAPKWNLIAGIGMYNGSFIMINGGRNLR